MATLLTQSHSSAISYLGHFCSTQTPSLQNGATSYKNSCNLIYQKVTDLFNRERTTSPCLLHFLYRSREAHKKFKARVIQTITVFVTTTGHQNM